MCVYVCESEREREMGLDLISVDRSYIGMGFCDGILS